MAGDWLKFETNTPEKREVLAMTIELGYEDPDLTVGKLIRVWRWFDQHTVNGNAQSVTPALLDRLIGVTGLTKSMANVGWMIVNEDGLVLPNFDRHNGKTAKERVLSAKRQANHKSNAKSNAESNGASVTSPLPREVKRREEIKALAQIPKSKKPDGVQKPPEVSDQLWADLKSVWATKKKAITVTALEKVALEAKKAKVGIDVAIRLVVENGWQGIEADWITSKIESDPNLAKIETRDDGRQWRHPVHGWVDAATLPIPKSGGAS